MPSVMDSCRRRLVFVASGMCIALFLACAGSTRETEEAIDEVHGTVLSRSEKDLIRSQAKITYVGEQSIPVFTLVFSTADHKVVMDQFRKFHAGRAAYGNDELSSTRQFTVTTAEFRHMLLAVRPILLKPRILNEHLDRISFTVVHQLGDQKEGQEFRLDGRSTVEFYWNLIDALDPENEAGRKILTDQMNRATSSRERAGG